MKIEFFKYQATGNDFIIIDNTKYNFKEKQKAQLSEICKRRFEVGADGIIFFEKGKIFSMTYYNSDGTRAKICGNGARSIVKFAIDRKKIKLKEFTFETDVGKMKTKIDRTIWVFFPFPDVKKTMIINGMKGVLVNSGVPHFIVETDNIDEIDVVKEGRKIRFSKTFKKNGTNVDFINTKNNRVRVYERGVENETLSCGSGAVAISGYYRKDMELLYPGGTLKTKIEKKGIWLGGDVQFVFKGIIDFKF